MCPLRITSTPYTPHQYHTIILLYTARDQNRAKSVQITTVAEYDTYIEYLPIIIVSTRQRLLILWPKISRRRRPETHRKHGHGPDIRKVKARAVTMRRGYYSIPGATAIRGKGNQRPHGIAAAAIGLSDWRRVWLIRVWYHYYTFYKSTLRVSCVCRANQ